LKFIEYQYRIKYRQKEQKTGHSGSWKGAEQTSVYFL
jgi:hypothetical protein